MEATTPKRYYVIRDVVPGYVSTTGRDEEIWLVKDRETGDNVDCGMTLTQAKARARTMERQNTEPERTPFLGTVIFCCDREDGL